MTHTLWEAAHCAMLWHHGQKRKYRGEPYLVHLAEVAALLKEHGQGDEVVAAGWLHDVVEDTGIGVVHIERAFGPRVADLVMSVTAVSRPEDGNRAARKLKDRIHYGRAKPEGKAIKLADLISNTRSIVADDPDFARVYLAEKALLLPLLEGSSAPGLHAIACEQIRKATTLGITLKEAA